MILLLGASGYIGRAFESELRARGWPYTPLARRAVDYTRFDVLLRTLRDTKAAFLVNCAGFTGKPNVDACETARAETLLGNTLLPQTIAQACETAGVPWGHVSSGCIYAGAKIDAPNGTRVEKDLLKPEIQTLLTSHPEKLRGFTEQDPPNFSFRDGPCSFYSGTKALAEESISSLGRSYVWRLRIPFDEQDNARNYLSKVQRYPKVYDNLNSLSHRGDFARACLDLWALRAPFGPYNVTNPGHVSTRQVVEMIERILKLNRKFAFWSGDAEFYAVAAKTPRSNCVMDSSKLFSAGVKMRPVREALEAALHDWQPESFNGRKDS
jgi:dTDP-4-dehydrorhamnose reductase